MHVHTSTDKDIRRISKVLLIVFIFMLVELWGHHKSNSLSLLADSVHLLVDILGFLVSLLSLLLSKKAPTKAMTFGYARFEIIGAIFSVLLIHAATAYLIIQSFLRWKSPKTIDSEVFVAIGVVGLFVNLYCLYALHAPKTIGGEKSSLNIRAAYIHVITDIMQSTGVVLASILLYINPRWVFIDILCTLSFALLVIVSTFGILKDALLIFLEHAPKGFDAELFEKHILEIQNIQCIDKVYCWSIDANKKALMMHLVLKDVYKYESTLGRVRDVIKKLYEFEYCTIQIDTQRTLDSQKEVVCDVEEVRGFHKLRCVNTS